MSFIFQKKPYRLFLADPIVYKAHFLARSCYLGLRLRFMGPQANILCSSSRSL